MAVVLVDPAAYRITGFVLLTRHRNRQRELIAAVRILAGRIGDRRTSEAVPRLLYAWRELTMEFGSASSPSRSRLNRLNCIAATFGGLAQRYDRPLSLSAISRGPPPILIATLAFSLCE
ncbi:hypothetical protein ACLMAJ_27695 [Nocardia sp. KC 131]|uniref:hypothetical protein n=1 Tax=Nocardia arseniciresistens TaxID=3392119 RepID=UPI00398E58DD